MLLRQHTVLRETLNWRGETGRDRGTGRKGKRETGRQGENETGGKGDRERGSPLRLMPDMKHLFKRHEAQFFRLSLSMVQSLRLAQRWFCLPRDTRAHA